MPIIPASNPSTGQLQTNLGDSYINPEITVNGVKASPNANIVTRDINTNYRLQQMDETDYRAFVRMTGSDPLHLVTTVL